MSYRQLYMRKTAGDSVEAASDLLTGTLIAGQNRAGVLAQPILKALTTNNDIPLSDETKQDLGVSYLSAVGQQARINDNAKQALFSRLPSYAASSLTGAGLGAWMGGKGNRAIGGSIGLLAGLLLNYGRRKLMYGSIADY